MGNCIITKLLGSVENNNLQKLGETSFEFITGTKTVMKLSSLSSITVSRIDGSTFDALSDTTERGTYTEISGNNFVTLYDKAAYKVISKYNITGIEGNCSLDAVSAYDNFSYSPLTSIVGGIRIDLSKLLDYKTTLTGVEINRFVEDIPAENITQMSGLTKLWINNVIQSTMIQWGRMLPNSVTTLRLGGINLTGTIEDFVSGRREARSAAGLPVSGSLSIGYLNNNIRFNGERVTNDSSVALSWTENTITYKGVTIDA